MLTIYYVNDPKASNAGEVVAYCETPTAPKSEENPGCGVLTFDSPTGIFDDRNQVVVKVNIDTLELVSKNPLPKSIKSISSDYQNV